MKLENARQSIEKRVASTGGDIVACCRVCDMCRSGYIDGFSMYTLSQALSIPHCLFVARGKIHRKQTKSKFTPKTHLATFQYAFAITTPTNPLLNATLNSSLGSV